MINRKLLALMLIGAAVTPIQAQEPTKVLFGDTHLHTVYSFDAYVGENRSVGPDTAYRWAKGEPAIHPYNRARVQIGTPLDFLVVADHAESMGVIRAIDRDEADFAPMGMFDNVKRWVATNVMKYLLDGEKGEAREFYNKYARTRGQADPDGNPVTDANNKPGGALFGDTSNIVSSAWEDIVSAADRHNEPGKFTALIGWEWSSIPTGSNLHRIIFTPDDAEHARQFLPYGSDQSQYPEDLWAWLEATQERTATRFVSIPHNSNLSKGYMFAETTLKDEPISADYARTRMKWEPVFEVTQIKGDSETHPVLSPDDEFADFESFETYMQRDYREYVAAPGDYARSALKRGLALEEKVGVNPFKFGMIGSTDSHAGLASYEEDNFWGKLAIDSIPENKGFDSDYQSFDKDRSFKELDMAAAGLAAVWAKDNTREEIYAAFKRREVYATTGTRMSVRLFAGWDFDRQAHESEQLAKLGYKQGVPMGGDLTAAKAGKSPQLLIRAVKDPKNANLDRIQVIKGWLDQNGQQHEKIYNVAWSDDRTLNADGSLAPVGNTVNLKTGAYDNSIGSPELSVLWTDPDFNAEQRAFYYVRVLQIPTPRHSLYDAIALQAQLPEGIAAVIQERAYTSPIWYTP